MIGFATTRSSYPSTGLAYQLNANQFADLLTQQTLNRMEGRSSKQVLWPDFKFHFRFKNSTEGWVANNKTVSFGTPSWYKSKSNRAVQQRRNVVTEEYEKKARDMNRVLQMEGDIEPVLRILPEYCPVMLFIFGGFNETNDEVHSFVGTRERLKTKRLAARRQASEFRLVELTGKIRRKIMHCNAALCFDCRLPEVKKRKQNRKTWKNTKNTKIEKWRK